MKTVVACEFCDGSFNVEYVDVESHVAARKAVLAHEQQCPSNPLVRRIVELERGVAILKAWRHNTQHPLGVRVEPGGTAAVVIAMIDEAFPEEVKSGQLTVDSAVASETQHSQLTTQNSPAQVQQ